MVAIVPQVICDRVATCGFRVHEYYFAQKPQFTPGICPRCGGPLRIVKAFTDEKIVGATMDLDIDSRSRGKITVPAKAATEPAPAEGA